MFFQAKSKNCKTAKTHSKKATFPLFLCFLAKIGINSYLFFFQRLFELSLKKWLTYPICESPSLSAIPLIISKSTSNSKFSRLNTATSTLYSSQYLFSSGGSAEMGQKNFKIWPLIRWGHFDSSLIKSESPAPEKTSKV